MEFLVSSLIHWTMDFEYEDGVEILHMARLINVIWFLGFRFDPSSQAGEQA